MTPEVIAAYSTVVLQGVLNNRGPHAEKWALMEPPSDLSLPCGVLVTSYLITVSSKHSSCLPVEKAVLAELSVVQSIINNLLRITCPTPQNPPISLDFGDSPVPAEWKERTTKLLNAMPEVFAQHDLDFGHMLK